MPVPVLFATTGATAHATTASFQPFPDGTATAVAWRGAVEGALDPARRAEVRVAAALASVVADPLTVAACQNAVVQALPDPLVASGCAGVLVVAPKKPVDPIGALFRGAFLSTLRATHPCVSLYIESSEAPNRVLGGLPNARLICISSKSGTDLAEVLAVAVPVVERLAAEVARLG